MQGGHPLTHATWAELAKAIVGWSIPPRWPGRGNRGTGAPPEDLHILFSQDTSSKLSQPPPHMNSAQSMLLSPRAMSSDFVKMPGAPRQGVTLARLPLTLAHKLCHPQLQAKERPSHSSGRRAPNSTHSGATRSTRSWNLRPEERRSLLRKH